MKKLINLRVIDQFWGTPSVSFEGCSRAQGSCRTLHSREDHLDLWKEVAEGLSLRPYRAERMHGLFAT